MATSGDFTLAVDRISQERADENPRACWVSGAPAPHLETTQIYEGTNQIQRIVMAKRLLG